MITLESEVGARVPVSGDRALVATSNDKRQDIGIAGLEPIYPKLGLVAKDCACTMGDGQPAQWSVYTPKSPDKATT